MKKFVSMFRVLALVFFCAAIFAVSYGALVLKNHNPFKKGADAESADGKGEGKDGEPMKASVDLDGTGGSGEASTAKAPIDPAVREKTIATGRALFSVPGPISIPQISDLMNELETARSDYQERKISLDLRERQLDAFSHELEQKRIEILTLTKQAQSMAPSSAGGVKSEMLDAKTAAALAKIFASMQPQAAANALNGYTPDRSAQILMAMKDDKIGEILSQMGSDGLKRITDAIARMKSSSEDESNK